MKRKGLLTFALAVVLILSMAVSAYADPGKGKGKTKFKPNNNKIKIVHLVDIKSHWAEQPILWMCGQGILTGYPDLTFRPNTPVTKYEAIMMISRASGFDGTVRIEPRRSWGKDVPAWMEDCLDFAVDEGILTEKEAADLQGWKPAKRYEVAVWAARAMGVDRDDNYYFQDLNDIPFYARTYVGGMFKHRFMVGYPGNVFQPNKPIARAELSVVLYRILLWQLQDDPDQNNGDEDYDDLELVSLKPADGSEGVDPSTSRLIVRFNLEVKAAEDNESVKDGIRVRNITDGYDVKIDRVAFKGKELWIDLAESLESNATYRVTIDDDIIKDKEYGQYFEGIDAGDWEFSTDYRELEILELTPENGATRVDGPETEVLEARFNGDIRVVDGKDLLSSVRVYNRTDREIVEIEKVEVDEDTLRITLEEPLLRRTTYEVTIRSNYFEDEDTGYKFEGLNGSEWRFTTR
ncbi:MAG TPA: Ig-like domain-containing protein [Bacillota bacterium]|jgi:hypothetical protein|nr:Ig-like domain-containing protein [Peptococcaceae bacterium MAG4]NLW38203.1 hypothetical protein [Peptococcaceae bacterium]HPZ43516.1 Ig-like domain-containing protein [Bacillota bacterium]HQD76346.1 Ig-like domain-containing protein [Bacillota bacterium]HUM58263.1 Ig-like domain-containing protein [Bacillota bacterium]